MTDSTERLMPDIEITDIDSLLFLFVAFPGFLLFSVLAIFVVTLTAAFLLPLMLFVIALIFLNLGLRETT